MKIPADNRRQPFLTLSYTDWLIFIFALLVRLLHIWMISGNPFFNSPILDADIFDQKAWAIASGSAVGGKAYFQAPLYLYFLAAIYALFGHNYLVPRLFQALLSALSAWLVYRLGKRVYDRRIGVIGAMIVALYGPLIHYSGQLLITTLFVFLVCLFLLLLDRLRDHPTAWNFLLTGAALGLAAITRPNILIFIPFALLWMLFRLKDRGTGMALFCAGIALLILPVTLRNYIVEKDIVLISSQGGVNFYMGNNPWATGRTAWVPGTSKNWWEEGYVQQREFAERNAGHPLKSSQVSAYWWKKAWEDMSLRPREWADLMLNKIRYLFAGYELSDTEDIYYQRKYSPIDALLMWDGIVDFPFGILLPLGLLGLALTFNWKRQSHLILFQISYAVGVLLFIITCRYRLPMVPLLAIWAAAGLMVPFRLLKAGSVKRYIWTFLGFLLLLIFVNRNPAKSQLVPLFDGAVNLGNKYLELKKYDQALAAFQEAMTKDSTSSRPIYGAGVALLNMGRIEEAKAQFEKAVKLEPTLRKAQNSLGRIFLQEGDYDSALQHFDIVLKVDSSDVFAQRGYADVALKKQDYATSAEHYERAYRLGATDRQLISRWAQALLLEGRYSDALRANSILLKREPNNPRVHHNQARIYAYCDSLKQAARELRTVLRLTPHDEDTRRELEEIQKLINTKP